MSFGGNSGGGTESKVSPYKPAEGALNQIIAEAGNLYNTGVKASGYVAPSDQTTEGIANMEKMANAANTQIADTLAGNYLNPFLSPMLQGSANQIATAINSEFSGAGRTPGSMMNQQQILSGITQEALPLAFDQYERERQRQLAIASGTPGLTTVGSMLENIEREKNTAPYNALTNYSNIINPIASGFPVSGSQTNPNRLTSATGGAMLGNMIFPGVGGAIGGALLGGLL